MKVLRGIIAKCEHTDLQNPTNMCASQIHLLLFHPFFGNSVDEHGNIGETMAVCIYPVREKVVIEQRYKMSNNYMKCRMYYSNNRMLPISMRCLLQKPPHMKWHTSKVTNRSPNVVWCSLWCSETKYIDDVSLGGYLHVYTCIYIILCFFLGPQKNVLYTSRIII